MDGVQPEDIPFATAQILPEADGFLFGIPTRQVPNSEICTK